MKTFSIGSKVFLVGEYVAIDQGPALVAVLPPRFEMRVVEKSESSLPLNKQLKTPLNSSFHPDSPAGKLLAQEKDFFELYDFDFVDPFQGKGGFGASTAQFALCLGALTSLSRSKAESLHPDCALRDTQWDYQKVLKAYQSLATIEGALPPSGADLIAQMQGGLCWTDFSLGKVEPVKWSFRDIDVLFVPTGQKVSTHQHLADLQKKQFINSAEFKDSGLHQQVSLAIEGIRKENSEQFCNAVSEVGRTLSRLGLVLANTQEKLTAISQIKGVIASKGCGALGADVLALVIEKTHQESIEVELKALGLPSKVGCISQLTNGLS